MGLTSIPLFHGIVIPCPDCFGKIGMQSKIAKPDLTPAENGQHMDVKQARQAKQPCIAYGRHQDRQHEDFEDVGCLAA